MAFNLKRAHFWLANFGFKRSLLSLLEKKLLKPTNHIQESTTLIDKVEEYDFAAFTITIS